MLDLERLFLGVVAQGLARHIAKHVCLDWCYNLKDAKRPTDIGTLRSEWEESCFRYLPESMFRECLEQVGVRVEGDRVYAA